MKVKMLFRILAGLILFGLCLPSTISAQSSQPDSTKKDLKEQTVQIDSVQGELILDTIDIKGKVEKPGVIIMPRRVEPEIKEKELERSFQSEVKEGVGEIPKPEKELRRLEKVKSIKKTVERKRK